VPLLYTRYEPDIELVRYPTMVLGRLSDIRQRLTIIYARIPDIKEKCQTELRGQGPSLKKI